MKNNEKEELEGSLRRFSSIDAAQLQHSLGQRQKMILFIGGPTGSGKTTLVRCIAKHLIYHLYNFSVKDAKDSGYFHDLMADVKPESIVVFEDYESIFDVNEQASKKKGKISLSMFFNMIDNWCKGIGPRIFVFTSRRRACPMLNAHANITVNLSNCTFHDFRFLATLYQQLPVGFEAYHDIEFLLNHIQIPQSTMCNMVKKTENDTTPEHFIFRIRQALVQYHGLNQAGPYVRH